MFVVYDPSGGFVTGGGWINSPASAYVAAPDLAAKASFGFVSKYEKGAHHSDGADRVPVQSRQPELPQYCLPVVGRSWREGAVQRRGRN